MELGSIIIVGRWRRSRIRAVVLWLVWFLLHGQVAESDVFTVGDRGGWTFNSDSWTNGKRFKAGDVIGTVVQHDQLVVSTRRLVCNN
jgi:hypothetical protein